MKTYIEILVSLIVVLMLSVFLSVLGFPITKDQPVIYFSAHKNPAGEIESVIKNSDKECKSILLVFGADWCPWCNRLSKLFDENEKIASILNKDYTLIKVDVGKWDKNLNLAEKYRVERKAGIPAIVILDCKGKWIKFQETSVLEEGKGYSEKTVLKFLSDNRKKP